MSYDAIKAINWSSLRYIATSPLLYLWRIDHPQPPTPTFIVGAAIHCLLFEPEKFDSRYAEFEGTRRGKAWDEWQEEHPDVQSLKPDELARVRATVAAIRAHKHAARILNGCRVEEPLTWIDAETGLACKGRLDGITPAYVVDLKTARDVLPPIFVRASARYLYHGQLAWYHDGAVTARKLDGETMPYLIAVQNDEPYDVVVWQMCADALAVGRAVYRSLLRKFAQCEAANWWPGCAPDVQTLTIPPYLEGVSADDGEEGF